MWNVMLSRAVPRVNPTFLIVLVGVFCFLLSPALPAQQGKPSEYKVEAVYLYNFGKFVQWSASAESPIPRNSFPICVLGQDPFGTLLDEILRGENIDGARLVAKRIEAAKDSAGCRILFISSSEEDRIVPILAAVQSLSVLTVSDMPDFCSRGGMIQFVLEGDKVRFEVNLTAAEKARLMLSSQLLKVAVSVQRNPR